jgi:hypothetical protein
MEEFRARHSKPKPKTEFTVEDDDLIWAYRRAHPKDKAKLDALDHGTVLKKARRWFADVIGGRSHGHPLRRPVSGSTRRRRKRTSVSGTSRNQAR